MEEYDLVKTIIYVSAPSIAMNTAMAQNEGSVLKLLIVTNFNAEALPLVLLSTSLGI